VQASQQADVEILIGIHRHPVELHHGGIECMSM
jgi:hypothetical protein